MTVSLTPSVTGRNETRNAEKSWKTVGKKRRQRKSAGYVRERRRRTRKRRRTKIRVKKGVTVTAAVALMKV